MFTKKMFSGPQTQQKKRQLQKYFFPKSLQVYGLKIKLQLPAQKIPVCFLSLSKQNTKYYKKDSFQVSLTLFFRVIYSKIKFGIIFDCWSVLSPCRTQHHDYNEPNLFKGSVKLVSSQDQSDLSMYSTLC